MTATAKHKIGDVVKTAEHSGTITDIYIHEDEVRYYLDERLANGARMLPIVREEDIQPN